MVTPIKYRQFARRLVDLCLENGRVSQDRVGEVLESLRKNPPRNHRLVLRLFLSRIERRIRENTLRMESPEEPGPALVAHMVDHYSKAYGRQLHPDWVENPDLVAGMRLRIADDVYEDSILSRLDQLQSQQN